MSVFPPNVYRDPFGPHYPEARHAPRASSNAAVVVTRQVTEAGFVEVVRHV